jgi:hypothetical protein
VSDVERQNIKFLDVCRELTREMMLNGRKDFLPVEPPPQADLSFLSLLGAPRFA